MSSNEGQVEDTLDGDLGFKEAQVMVDQWIQSIGVRYFSELTNLAQLMEEVGELARIISRSYGEQSSKKGDRTKELSDELADILFVVICLANQTGVDLVSAFRTNIIKKTVRDAERHKRNPKLSRSESSAKQRPDKTVDGSTET